MDARFSPWKALVAFVCLPTAAQSALAQSFDATHLSEPTLFSMPILLHAGDDPGWARPDFDDSNWIVVDPNRSLKDYFPREPRPDVVWYRLHIKVSPAQTGLALGESYLANAFEIFVNGKELLSNGSVNPYAPFTGTADLLARIPDKEIATGALVVALRVHISRAEWTDVYPCLYPTNVILGRESALRDRFWLQLLSENSQSYINDLLFLCLGVVALALFAAQRQRTEYLWLFLFGLSDAAGDVMSAVDMARNFSVWLAAPARSLINTIFEISLIGLGLGFIQVKPSARVKVLIGLATLLFLLGQIGGTSRWLGDAAIEALNTPIQQIIFVAIPIVFLVHFRRGNLEAGVLLVPWLMQTVNIELGNGVFWLSQIARLRDPIHHFWRAVAFYHVGPFQLTLGEFINTLVVTSWGLILVWRTIRITREQSRTENELEAARQVQQVILPQESYSIPGFAVEAIYKPAQQVGGDFFQVLPVPGDGLLLVVGDVAGKGMPAAMLVAVLVGAVRTLARFTCDPGEILAELNVRLLGRTGGGFSTCLVAHIDSHGTVRLANAGHPAPYLDGREIETPGALPLGIGPGQTYEGRSFAVDPGSRLTFYTDGVVEAQNKQGKLLGFERAGALSGRAAREIADAAVEFGQQDDITVITVEREPTPAITLEQARAAAAATLHAVPLEPA